MGKHEIRLRKQRITARGSDRYRNYGSVLKQHEEDKRIKVIVKIFTYFLIVVVLILMYVAVSLWENKDQKTYFKNSKVKIINHIT